MSRDWWSRITLPLRQMQTMGLPIASPADLTPTVWYAYVDARLANGIAQSTLNGTLFSLKGWLSWLDDFADTDDPQLRVDPRMLKLQPLRQPSRVPKDVPIDDLIKLQRVIELEAINPNPHTRWRGTMDLAWFLLMLHAGLRTGEVRRLRLDDIDWSRRHIRIEASKHLKSRIAPFSQHAATALNNWITLRTDSTLIAGVDLPNTVFFDRHVSLSESYCYSRLSTYGGRCNVKGHPHQLRHSCATLLLNAGMPLPQVQAVLGHVSIETTRGYARSYDGTVAADYTRAMLSVEQDLQLTPDPTSAQSTPTPAQVIALLDSLKTLGVLNPQQRDALAQVRAALIARSRQV